MNKLYVTYYLVVILVMLCLMSGAPQVQGIYRYRTLDVKIASPSFGRVLADEAMAVRIARCLFLTKQDDQEHSLILVTDASMRLKGHMFTNSGNIDGAEVDFSILFRDVVLLGGSRFIFIHNHPGVEARPSESDERLTRVLTSASMTMDLVLLDHVILGEKNTYYSYLEAGLMPKIYKQVAEERTLIRGAIYGKGFLSKM